MSKSTVQDILLWLLLAMMWGSSYAVIKVGVAPLPVMVLVAGRMLVGSAVILAVLKLRGMRLSRRLCDWGAYAVTGLLGSVLPFLLITQGEKVVDSALASILIGVAPVVTLLLANWLIADERMTVRSIAGVCGGLAGVAVLVGPSALGGIGAHLGGQVAILAAAVCYAASTIFIRRWVRRPALEMAAGSMLVGTAVICTVAAMRGADVGAVDFDLSSLGTIVYLGLFSTACANLIYFHLVPRLGATRMAQVNFAVPVAGVVIGTVVLGEVLTAQRLLALTIICGSVWNGTTGRGRTCPPRGCVEA
ncbi:DMT family transporter [Algicella marina]|uniref:EamA family transporter n=1 Tax=Algicella marina TaxID=2683284 RepID=A0A6P1T4N9_9RHOB|nr:DMT family transporter [Algicella marina]QHQ36663.1 EamA family transporter [Algicella marina]